MAATSLKRAEGIVTVIVCNPNKKDDKGKDGKGDKNGEKPKKPEKSKDPEAPPPDPAAAPVVANKETTIEMNTNDKSVGVYVVGGKMYSQAPMAKMTVSRFDPLPITRKRPAKTLDSILMNVNAKASGAPKTKRAKQIIDTSQYKIVADIRPNGKQIQLFPAFNKKAANIGLV